MSTRLIFRIVAAAALLVVFATAGCSTTSHTREQPSETTTETTAEENTRLEQLYWARQDSARTAYTQADVRFMTGMIKHHAQAVVMSRLAPTHAESNQVQTLAARIINSQRAEINLMQNWLRNRNEPVPEIKYDGTQLTTSGESIHGMPMAGILTEEQIQQLDAAQGPEFDRLFLEYMIEHHAGALTMVDRLFATDGAAQGDATFRLASDIYATQETEIARMERMLSVLPDLDR